MKQEKDQEPVKHEAAEQPIAQNPNPRANENIRVRSDDPVEEGTEQRTEGVGTEITDGEAG